MPDVTQNTFEDFLSAHKPQLLRSNVPEQYWKTLFTKLNEEIFDAGNVFSIMIVDYHGEDESEDAKKIGWKVVVTDEKGIDVSDGSHIYLIDHAWTYRISSARGQLMEIPGLLDRMAMLMDIDGCDKDKEVLVEEVMEQMWRFNQTYSLGNMAPGSEEAMPIWYIMDEFGSRIQHSDTPSCSTAPFYHIPSQMCFTILWPLKNMEEGDECCRDFIGAGVIDPLVHKASLLPWLPDDLTHLSYEQTEPGDDYFSAYRIDEENPNLDINFPPLPKDRNIKVYSDLRQVRDFLTDPRFEVIENSADADILWLFNHFKDFKNFSEEMPEKYINQFPNEQVVNVKDLLAIVSRRAADQKETDPFQKGTPKWLPVTYNLQKELPQFVSYFQNREKSGLGNHWICKPWNLARALDTHITNNLNYIVRLPSSGPKVACKYIENPVLFHREDVGDVKFDYRYMVGLASVKPLKLYAYRVFWLRFANQVYSMDHFDEYEKHFTVMNYENPEELKQLNYDEFMPIFDSQYPDYPWESKVEKDIFACLKELFTAACSAPTPRGISHSPQSRAIYAVDMMLDWCTNEKGEKYMQPMVLEVNFCPDNNRACKYHPDFYNHIFTTLFCEDTSHGMMIEL